MSISRLREGSLFSRGLVVGPAEPDVSLSDTRLPTPYKRALRQHLSHPESWPVAPGSPPGGWKESSKVLAFQGGSVRFGLPGSASACFWEVLGLPFGLTAPGEHTQHLMMVTQSGQSWVGEPEAWGSPEGCPIQPGGQGGLSEREEGHQAI